MFRTSRPIRYINQHIPQIIGSIIVILFILLVINIANNIAKKNNEPVEKKVYTVEEIQEVQNGYVDEETIKSEIDNISNIIYKKEEIQIIEEFINYCNNAQIDKAYSLLSNLCKEVVFPTQDEFYNDYYKKIFDNKKTYNLGFIKSNQNIKTYKIAILDDIMASGVYDASKVHEEYMTVAEENGETRLNINNFIKVEELKNAGITKNVAIVVNKRYIYSDYEIYSITAFNATNSYMELDSLARQDSTYLIDSNNNKFYMDINKVKSADLKIYPFTSRNITIRISKNYIEGSKILAINFSDITFKNDTNEEKRDNVYIEFN